MKSIELRWRPGTARFEARGKSGAWMTLAAPGEPEGTPSTTGRTAAPPARARRAPPGGERGLRSVGRGRDPAQAAPGRRAIDCHVDGDQQAEAPWTFRRVALAFTVRGRDLDQPAVLRAVELAVEKYCAVLSTVAHAATVEHVTRIEDDGVPA